MDETPAVEAPQTRMRRDAPAAPPPEPVAAPQPEEAAQEAKFRLDDMADGVNISPSSASSAGGADSVARAVGRSSRGGAVAGGVEEAERAAEPASQLAQILGRARAARQRGSHRVAVREYETYLKKSPVRTRLNEVWFEAAQSYEALGDLLRARQLYRLVARSRSGKSAAAQIRVDEIGRRLDIGSPPPPEEPLGRPNMGL